MRFVLIPMFLLIIGLFGFGSIYIVNEIESAIILELGKPVRVITEPGIYFKVPVIQNVMLFDKRIKNINIYSTDSNEVVTSDQKTMKIDSYAKYKIHNPLRFFKSVQNEEVFRERLVSILESSAREVIGSISFSDLIGSKRDLARKTISINSQKQLYQFGVDIIDFRIIRLNLPDIAKNSVYDRMRTDRYKEAMQIRSEGYEEAKIIRANADKDSTILIAEAKSKAEIIKGEGDATANQILIEAAKNDPDFFVFYKSLDSYEKTFMSNNSQNRVLIISPKSKYFNTIFNSINK